MKFGNIGLGRKFSVALVCFLLTFATLAATNGLADESSAPTSLSYTFSFKEPNMGTTELYNEVFTQVNMPGCMAIGQGIGIPNIPVKFIKLLLPPGMDIADIDILATPVELPLNDVDLLKEPVTPYQHPVPFGEDPPDEISFDDEIYDSPDLFPSEILKNQGIGYSRGYAILTIALTPIQYIPAEGSLFYYPEMTVNIELEGDGAMSHMYRDDVDDEAWVKQLVWNPELVDCYQTKTLPAFSYPGGLCDPSDSYDYVIITTTHNGLDHWATSTSLPYNWTSLMDKHGIQDGLSCTLLTMQDIDACPDYYNSTPFNDTPAHIREFCRDAYADWDTDYIFIGGDDEWIPAREMDYDYESNVDADIYWNHLDKTFNDDGDNDWGEEGDSGFDLYAEMYIGRITCDEPQDVSNWMKKSFYYADSFEKDYLDNAAFYGGNTGWDCQGDDFIDYSAIKGTNDWLGPDPHADGPYPTWAGFQYGFETWNALNTGKEYNMSVMWTAEPPNPGWQGGSESQAITGLKNAISSDNATLIAGIAHANADMSLDVGMSSWESDYHNTKPFFLHDYGCHCGDMDASSDGVLHSMLFHSDTELAFGCVYNTGYGWGNFDGTNSSSALQQKLFWDYFFDTTNNSITPLNWQLGKAMAYSKDEMAPTINWTTTGAPGSWRGIIESCLLFGDPAQRVKPPFQPEHGIAVVNLDVDDVVAHGETIYVEALIVNVGSNNESSILVNFTVNETVLDDTIIGTLDVGQSELVSFTWNPDYGTYLVGIEAQPVPGENITDNNAVNKTVHVIPAPDIWISPTGFDFHVNAGESDYGALTVGNEAWAETSLLFNASVSGGSWLSVVPDTGVVSIDDSMILNVSVDAASLTEGFYQAYIVIDCNDLDESVVSVLVNLSVVFADDVGAINVNSPVGQQMPGSYVINATVENFGSEDNTFQVNCSIYEAGGSIIEDFEGDDGGYTHDQGPGPGSIDDWEWGTPTYGPSSAHSGSNCWATNLDGDHSNSADSVLDSILIDLNMYSPTPQLKFWHWYDHTTYDCGNVKISTDGGASWSIIYPDSGYTGTATSGNQGIPGEPAFTDISSGWEQVRFNLSAYEEETVMLRWHFGSTSSTTHPGWYIDDVELSSSLIRNPGDLVYSSIESVSLLAYTTGFVEFSPAWYVLNYSYYVIDVNTELAGDEDTINDDVTGIVQITGAPAGHISLLLEGWNFVSLPFNQSINKGSLLVNVDGFDHTWSDAVAAGYVNDYVFGWDRSGQAYMFADTLAPGYGYWMYTYESCELKAPTASTLSDGYITGLESYWNIIGMPDDVPLNKTDIIVNYDGSDYTWDDAVTYGYINGNIFGWDHTGQSYTFSDILEPGYAYWMYAYYDCTLKQ